MNTEAIVRRIEHMDATSEMVVNPFGARIERLALRGVDILATIERGDGKTASTHPCTPIFGPETITTFGLTRHGPMRDETCAIEQVSDHAIDLLHEIKAGTYPEGLVVIQRFFIAADFFSLVTIHNNMNEQAKPVNFGEHFYWNAPIGWEGLKINGQDVTEVVKNDAVIKLANENEILIPGQPKIILRQEGLYWANLWAYQDEQSGQYDTHYVCIEPVERNPQENPFGTDASLIAPFSVRVTRLSISL